MEEISGMASSDTGPQAMMDLPPLESTSTFAAGEPLLQFFEPAERQDVIEIFSALESNSSFSEFAAWPSMPIGSVGRLDAEPEPDEEDDDADLEIVDLSSLSLEDKDPLDHVHLSMDDLVAAGDIPEENEVLVEACGTPLPLSPELEVILLSDEKRKFILEQIRSSCKHSAEESSYCDLSKMSDSHLITLQQSFLDLERQERHQAVQFLLLAGMSESGTVSACF